MSNVVSLQSRRMNLGAPRVTPKGNRSRNAEQQEKHIENLRVGLINYLTARRRRLGMTDLDIRQSPEQVWAKEQTLRDEQQALVDNYLQTRASVNMM